jgi:SAM-dependent methyltransferase
MSAGGSTAYDTVVYPSRCCPQAHPDRLATLASLFGMSPAPVERCRVLEIGCGDGRNLVALAHALPDSGFVGVDLAPSAIARAKHDAQSLGLTNIEFYCADLLDWLPPEGQFDYLIAHGFISWVPDAVRRKVFELCRERLSPRGVAYVSYNALPGWHVRGVLRQMMLFHTQQFSDPVQKITQAKAFLGLLLAGLTGESAATAVVKEEAHRILNLGADTDAMLFHDLLAETNRPFYLYELAALAGQHGLQFLAESDFHETKESEYPPPVAAALQSLGGNAALKEQYLDFLKCRGFRQTLLCRREVPLNRELKSSLVRQYLLTSNAKAESPSPNLTKGVVEGFAGPGVTMQVDDPLTKAAILELLEIWPRALPFGELVSAARRRLGRLPAENVDGEEDRLAEALLAAYSAGVVELHVFQAPWMVARRTRPLLSTLARFQIANGQVAATTLRHTDVRLDSPIYREMLLLLDGTRDLSAVAVELGRRVDAGEVTLPAGAARENFSADVAQAVRDAAASGLLNAWDPAST